MTPNREDYIKTIYSYNERHEKLSNKTLAEKLSVSPASTSEMIRKLMNTELVSKDEVYGFVLSSKGVEEAQVLLRKHRLWEVFLIEYLGYSWAEVHDDAEILEHSTSDLLADRLSDFLGKPEYCPHGSKIYGNIIEDTHKNSLQLAELNIGETGQIVRVRDDATLLKYMESIGLNIDDPFEVIDIEAYEGPYHINVNGNSVSLSYKAAQEIAVIRVGDKQ